MSAFDQNQSEKERREEERLAGHLAGRSSSGGVGRTTSGGLSQKQPLSPHAPMPANSVMTIIFIKNYKINIKMKRRNRQRTNSFFLLIIACAATYVEASTSEARACSICSNVRARSQA